MLEGLLHFDGTLLPATANKEKHPPSHVSMVIAQKHSLHEMTSTPYFDVFPLF